jgi:hypothetical protein
MVLRYGREDCKHELRASTGYEEYCASAICIDCGAIGCFCDAERAGVSKEVFFEKEYEIDANINGKWKNPYVEKKREAEKSKLVNKINASFLIN